MNVITFLKNWMLPIAMIVGFSSYYIYLNIPGVECIRPQISSVVSIVQPTLIFAMLFLTFCRVPLHDLRLRKWHLWLLLVQVVLFMALGSVIIFMPDFEGREIVESAMLCLICPTATAAAVVVRKLGGNVANNTLYLILINIVVAIVIPAIVPLIHPRENSSFATSFLLIIGKVFPLLILPILVAYIVRHYMKRLNAVLTKNPDLPFYLWSVALALAMAMTAKSIHHSDVPLSIQLWIAIVSLICCAMQFLIGRKIGKHYGDEITAGQSLGQKNTVLAIWLGYTFFTPITAIAGGFYSIWHNSVNSYQLYKNRKQQ